MSQLPSDLPQLPKWPFLCADAVLLGTATLIAAFSNTPTQGWPLISVLVCVVAACVLCAIPFLTDYARSQDQALDERQRSLEGLAKTVASSAEQISIAVQGLGRLDEQLQRHLRQIDQVPQKINERLGDLQQRLATTREGEIEELERELSTLKASEGDRLESVMDQLQRATAELARLEQSAARHAEQSRTQGAAFQASVADSVVRLTSSVDQSLLRSAELVSSSLSSARTEIDALLSASHQRLAQEHDSRSSSSQEALDKAAQVFSERLVEIENASLVARQGLEELDRDSRASSQRQEDLDKVSQASVQRLEALAVRLEQVFDEAGQRLSKVSGELVVQASAAQAELAAKVLTLVPVFVAPSVDTLVSAPIVEQADIATLAQVEPLDRMPVENHLEKSLSSAVSDEEHVQPPSQPVVSMESPSVRAATVELPVAKTEPSSAKPAQAAATPERSSRKSVSSKKVQAVVSSAPAVVATVPPQAEPVVQAPSEDSSPVADSSKGRQPRKKPEPVPAGMVLDLFNENFSLEDHHDEPLVSRAVSADGATRIIVTAYIGIGNKLFIRGDGPGMSWERGQALQFVSIGKWRWESLEAESSFRFKLYKNDQLECGSLGEQRIDAGQQTELTANF